jgi:hypothetical protein
MAAKTMAGQYMRISIFKNNEPQVLPYNAQKLIKNGSYT